MLCAVGPILLQRAGTLRYLLYYMVLQAHDGCLFGEVLSGRNEVVKKWHDTLEFPVQT